MTILDYAVASMGFSIAFLFLVVGVCIFNYWIIKGGS